MIDCHYDLLTYILMKKKEKEFIKEYCKKVYRKDNIIGGIFNLFYMSENEMKEEIGIEKINVIEDLTEAKKYIDNNKIIPKDIKYIFGIEGLDYLENIEDLDILYSLGLRAVNPVWNNQNKFGGGIRANKDCGLTPLGDRLIEKLVDNRMAIDLSHSNEKTFFDIIDKCKKLKELGKEPIVFASHSNSKVICDVPRNLTDKQIISIKELKGIIGVVSIKRFCINSENVIDSKINYEQRYIEHINYIKELLGNVDNICVSTDDMKYYYIEPEYYQNANIYEHSEVKSKLKIALKRNNYSEDEINKILEKNFKEKILNRL